MKTFLEKCKSLFATNPEAAEAVPALPWIDGSQNRYGVRLLDLSSSVAETTAWSTRKDVAENFMFTRNSDGAVYVDRLPENPADLRCDLSFKYSGAHNEGPVFKARCMEDKWDMYIYGNSLYAVRSWTGELSFVALCEFKTDRVGINRIAADRNFTSDDGDFAIRTVDYLIKSHMSNMVVPHPLPSRLRGAPFAEIAAQSFSLFGRRGLYGTFDETVGILGPQATAESAT